MKLFDVKTKTFTDVAQLDDDPGGPLFLLATPDDMLSLQTLFAFDNSTVMECINYDENIRHSSFSGYDFVSLVYCYLDEEKKLASSELNVFYSERYCIFVAPNHEPNAKLDILRERILQRIGRISSDSDIVSRLLYIVLDELLQGYSESLEEIEDAINALETVILDKKVDDGLLEQVYALREMTYQVRKMTRPLLYVGDALLVNENGFLSKAHRIFFSNLDTRINKLYDFCVSLQEYSNQTLQLYESKVSMQTNDVVNKLTVLTLFFAPLTLITGIYGMNFIHMPELKSPWGYPVVLGVMAGLCGLIYWVLKKKKWL